MTSTLLHVQIVVRPARAELLVQRLMQAGWADAVSAVECRGYGRQRGGQRSVATSEGRSFSASDESSAIAFLPKVLVECIIDEQHRGALIELACATGRTGHIGDGKIFLRRIESAPPG